MMQNTRIPEDDEEFRTLFPYRLHQLLTYVEKEGLSHIISWFPCGTKFKVHNVKQFTTEVMPKIGRFTRYKSFLRQLSMYKFQRIVSEGAYQHPYFRREHIDLCRAILRGEIYNPTTTKQRTKQHQPTMKQLKNGGRGGAQGEPTAPRPAMLRIDGAPALESPPAGRSITSQLHSSLETMQNDKPFTSPLYNGRLDHFPGSLFSSILPMAGGDATTSPSSSGCAPTVAAMTSNGGLLINGTNNYTTTTEAAASPFLPEEMMSSSVPPKLQTVGNILDEIIGTFGCNNSSNDDPNSLPCSRSDIALEIIATFGSSSPAATSQDGFVVSL